MAEEPVKVELPGEGLYGESCYIQTFTINDARKLYNVYRTGDTDQLFGLLNERINLDIKKLTLQDLWFILHWQRINSYPSYPMRVPWECPHCDHKNNDELSASKLIIKDVDPIYEHGIMFNFPSAINNDGEPVHIPLRLPLVGDELEADTFIEKVLKIEDPSEDLVREVMFACTLEPMGGTLEERYLWGKDNVNTLEDELAYREFEKEFNYGVMNYVRFNCEDCGEEEEISLEFDLSSFFPDIRDTFNVRSRILSSKTPTPEHRESGNDGSSESPVYTKSRGKSSKSNEAEDGFGDVQDEVIVKDISTITGNR